MISIQQQQPNALSPLSSLASTKYRPEAIETAVERVVAFMRKLLMKSPKQLLAIVERQARQLLVQQSALAASKQQLQSLQNEVDALQETQFIGSY